MMKEIDQTKTSLEDLKSRSRPERPLLKVCRWILACQYAILTFIVILVLFSGQSPSMRKLHTDTKANKLKSLHHPSSILEPVRGISSKVNVKTFEKDKDSYLLEKIQSNPFRLSKNDITQQMKSAKIPSLRNRVKRFACWHSCFGQFRRKAFRTLYPKSILSPTPTPLPAVTTVSEEPENPDKKEENKEVKRETQKDGGDAPEIIPLPGNNDLSEVEPKAGLDVNGTNPKQNTTDFFKLKTKEKESVRLSNNDSSSTSTTDQHHSAENPAGSESGSEKKATSKDESGRNSKAVLVQSQEVSESEDGDGYEESESPEGKENESSISVSEEAIEDKGDGIDKKDMEAEKSR